VSKPLFHRLFGAGRWPAPIRAEIDGERMLYDTEGVVVTTHFSGRVPGKVARGDVMRGWGAFAVTDRRVLGTRGRAKIVDVPFAVEDVEGPATVELDHTGLHVVFDLDRVHASCHGELRVHFHEQLTDVELGRFPSRRLSFRVDPQKVVRLTGSLKKLPSDG
jgi:hypothetical protein